MWPTSNTNEIGPLLDKGFADVTSEKRARRYGSKPAPHSRCKGYRTCAILLAGDRSRDRRGARGGNGGWGGPPRTEVRGRPVPSPQAGAPGTPQPVVPQMLTPSSARTR